MIELLVPEGREIVVHGQVRRVMQEPKPLTAMVELAPPSWYGRQVYGAFCPCGSALCGVH